MCPLVSHCVDFCSTLVLALRKLLYTHNIHALSSLHTPSFYIHQHQFLLGGFYWIEAVALFEDIAGGLKALNTTSGARISGVDYYDPATVTTAYHNAAL